MPPAATGLLAWFLTVKCREGKLLPGFGSISSPWGKTIEAGAAFPYSLRDQHNIKSSMKTLEPSWKYSDALRELQVLATVLPDPRSRFLITEP
jgi:hypothetical protein